MSPEADEVDRARAGSGGVDPRPFGGENRRQHFVLPRRVRRRRSGGASLFTTAWRQLQWSASRPAGRRAGGRGDDLRPRRRAKHAGSPFGATHRRALWSAAVILTALGGLLALGGGLPLTVVGGCVALVGLLVGTSLLWGRPFPSLHAQSDRGRERRLRLRALLEGAASNLEHIAAVDPAHDPEWIAGQCARRADAARSLIDRALGPAVAEVYDETKPNEPQAGVAGRQGEAAAKAFYVRYLVAYLDRFPIMSDWNP